MSGVKRILIAPDSFKESLDAGKAAEAIASGFKRVFPRVETVMLPLSDGGEGLVRTLVAATGGRIIGKRVTGPLGEPVDAFLGILGDNTTCVIEMAAASGLPLVARERRNPMITTTYGTGELIKAALDTACKKIIIGIGGSATNDGGAGMAQALGIRLLTAEGKDIGYGAQGVKDLAFIDMSGLDPRLKNVSISVAVDVENPLCGPDGASYVYGPQKGGTPDMLPFLDDALEHFAMVVKKDLNKDVKNVPGAGAAGGLGAGLVAFLGARLQPGIDIVLEVLNMETELQNNIDLVITGEGELNEQTAFGKAPAGVARLAKKHNIPVIALVGSIGEGAQSVLEQGIDAYFSVIPRPMALAESIKEAHLLLADLAEQCARLIKAVRPAAPGEVKADD